MSEFLAHQCDCCKKVLPREYLKGFYFCYKGDNDNMVKVDGTREIELCRDCEQRFARMFVVKEEF